MPGTGDSRPIQLASAERSPLVHAGVVDGVDGIAHSGQGQPPSLHLDQQGLVGRNLLDPGHPALAHISSFSTRAWYSPLMYCQRISVAWRTASMAMACLSAVSACCSTIW